MRELSKSIIRRMNNYNFISKYFVGKGVDIGGKPDPLAMYVDIFPLMENVKVWDLDDGDAQFMESVKDNTYDFVCSSHCLEHLQNPEEGLANWIRVVKPGGYVIITVPDEDLYEQGEFPSTFNADHKHSFTIFKPNSWCEKSINVLELVQSVSSNAQVEKIELLNSTFRQSLPRYDQTLTPIGECAIEIVLRKTFEKESTQGIPQRYSKQPPAELKRYYNQYKADQCAIISGNQHCEPFTDETDL